MIAKLSALNAGSTEEFVCAIGPVYEHSPHFAERVAGRRPFASAEELGEILLEEVNQAGAEEKMALIQAHPDLVCFERLTKESQGEQVAAGLGDLSQQEMELFRQYNEAYRGKFGFPFIICARLQKKKAILEAFPRRLHNEIGMEQETALEEIHKIAALRLHDILWEN